MKKYSIFLIILVFSLIESCGGGGGGGGDQGSSEENLSPIADAGLDQRVNEGDLVTLDGSNSSDPEGNTLTFKWVQESGLPVNLSDDTAEQPTFTAPEVGEVSASLTFELTVSDGKKSAVATCTVTVLNIAVLDTEDVLFAAYAGIGYMSQDSDVEDDEALYNVMLDDVAALTGQMVVNAILNDQDKWSKIFQLLMGGEPVFEYNEPAYNVTLHIIPQGDPPAQGEETTWILDMALTANFSDGGFPYNDLVTYYGSDTDDLVAQMEVEVSASQDPISGQQSSTIIINSFEIHMNAAAEYSESAINLAFSIYYDDWFISYSVDDYPNAVDENGINLNILPIGSFLENLGIDLDMEDTPDHRLYTLDGGFEIEVGTEELNYNFSNVKYGQLDAEGRGINYKFIAIEGDVGVPNLVHVSSPASSILDGDFSAIGGIEDLTNVISRDGDGLWKSGQMTITEDKVVNIEFNEGAAEFECDLSEWSIENWQDDLDPLMN